MDNLMDSALASLKTIKLWQFLAAVIVFLGAAGATFGVYDRVSAPPSLDLQEDQQIIPVQYGDLINQVSTSGNLTFPNRNVLRFGSQGRVAAVLVEEGETVKAGQALAEIDQSTAASLSLAAAQAKVDLLDAQRGWDDLSNPNGKRIAEARAKVADAELGLQSALTSLADLPIEHEQELAKARQAVADAELALAKAEDSLFGFPGEFRQTLAEAELLVRERQLALEQAQNDLTDFHPDYQQELADALQAKADAELTLQAELDALQGFRPDYAQELAQARDSQAKAQRTLDAAQQALEDFEPSHERQLANALQAEVDGRERLQSAQQALERYVSANSNRLTPVRERKAELEKQIEQAQADLDRLVSNRDSGVGGLTAHIHRLEQTLDILEPEFADASESLVAWERLAAEVQVSESLLASALVDLELLSPGPDRARRAALEAELAVARSELALANEAHRKLEDGPDWFQGRNLEAAVEVAKAEVSRLTQHLERLQEGPSGVRRQQLLFAVEKAEAELALAEDALNNLVLLPALSVVAMLQDRVEESDREMAEGRLTLERLSNAHPDSPETARQRVVLEALERAAVFNREGLAAIQSGADARELELREAELALAYSVLALVRQELEALLKRSEPLELVLRQDQVTVAKANLAESQRALNDLLTGEESAEVLLAKSKLDAALKELEHAIGLEEDAVLRSPIDGFVSALHVEAGEQVNANAPIVEVVDPSVVEVDGVVDEIDVLLVPLGTRADISLDALPGRNLEGIVSQIAPASVNQQGVVTYPIRVTVEVPPGMVLREGLTTVANLVLQEERNVLLIPQQSLYGTFDSPVVRLVSSQGEIQETSVELGNSDDFWVEVRSGLKEGDRLAMDSQTVTTTGSGFRSLRGATGGGRGRGVPSRR